MATTYDKWMDVSMNSSSLMAEVKLSGSLLVLCDGLHGVELGLMVSGPPMLLNLGASAVQMCT